MNQDLIALYKADPRQKKKLVKGLQSLDKVVAFVGDGDNDELAVKKADVGFAMGVIGSDDCKEAADVIILDDRLNGVVNSILWGRNQILSMRKFL